MTATAVRERPIIMSAKSVAATLAGTKTQTRRVIKPRPPWEDGEPKEHSQYPGLWIAYTRDGRFRNGIGERRCPYGVPGDRLWIRERWWQLGRWSTTKIHVGGIVETVPRYWRALAPETPEEVSITVRATVRYGDEPPGEPPTRHVEWRRMSPLFMPRWASRLTLAITQVRVERLHDITEEDALAEGYAVVNPDVWYHRATDDGRSWTLTGPVGAFAACWDVLDAKRGFGWETNCWVWVVSYRRVEP